MLPPLEKNKKSDLYSVIGVDKNAKPDDIKSAYREKAKKLHPDKNLNNDTSKEFLELSNAYKILGNNDKKLAYDLKETIEQEDVYDEIPYCSMCKTKSHNLRFVIFKEVTNTKLRYLSKTIQGIYCLKCANIASIRASMRTWLSGFWIFPIGTFFSALAIFNNLSGGKKPKKLNSRLLINHARNLINNGELAKAKFIAKEALKFTKKPEQITIINDVIKSLSTTKEKKETWRTFNIAFLVQISPFIMLLTLFMIMFSYYKMPEKNKLQDLANINQQENLKVINLPDNPLDENLIFSVKSDKLNIHQGPGINFGIIETIPKNTKIRIIGLVPGTLWVKVKTENSEGFIISEFITKIDNENRN